MEDHKGRCGSRLAFSYTTKEYFQVWAGQKNTAARERPAMLPTISKSPVTFAMYFLVPAPEDHFRKWNVCSWKAQAPEGGKIQPNSSLKHLRLNRYRNCWDVLLAGDLQKVRLDCYVILFGLNIFERSLNQGRKCTSKYGCQIINLLWDWWR